jgi:bacteriorhodopsin
MGNDALRVNPSDADVTINTNGSNWLWAVFAVMLFTDLLMMAWMFTLPKGRRTFHHLAIFILTTAAISYFSMASNLGSTPIPVEFNGNLQGLTRAIWYVRYIDWVITTPFLLLELVLATGLPLSDIIALIFFDEVMIITGLVGALVASTYKFGYFAFGCAALIYIWVILLGPALKSSATLGPEFRKAYMRSAAYLSFIWMLYPICWGLSDGANVISPDSEMVFYGVLDLLAKPVFTAYHVWQISRLDYTKMQLQSGKFSEGAAMIRENELANVNNSALKNARADATATGRFSEATAREI